MPAPVTYSFLDVVASLIGPGGAFALGSGAGAAEEGISIEPVEDIDALTVGADGSTMHSLRANKAAKITIRLLKTSPVNEKLSTLLAFQRVSAVNHGQNTLTIENKSMGDVITCQQVGFARAPNVMYARDAGMMEWTFNAGIVDIGLGAGV
jgi:hypothetical protein